MFGKIGKKRNRQDASIFNPIDGDTVGSSALNQGGFNQGGFNQDDDETVGLSGGAKVANQQNIGNTNKIPNSDEGETVSYSKMLDDETTITIDAYMQRQTSAVKPMAQPVVGWLVCTEGSEKGRDFKFFSGRSSIGRSLKCDIAVSTDQSINDKDHAFIIYDPRSTSFYLQAGSGSCCLNGGTVEMAELLHNGDIIKCGDSTFCFIPFCKEDRKW